MIELGSLSEENLSSIERIERRSYPTPWSRTMFASELAKRSSICLGAFEASGQRLAGYLIVSRYVDAWHVMNLAIDVGFRRQGIATTLLDELFQRTRDDELRGYTLEVRVSNVGAIGLYESVGFTPRGTRRGYYTDNREDAIVMWKGAVPLEATRAPALDIVHSR